MTHEIYEDYVIVTPEEVEANEFEFVPPVTEEELLEFKEQREQAPEPVGAYDPDNLNRMTLKKFKEKFSYQESFVKPDKDTLFFHCFNNGTQKIVLGGVSAEFETKKDFPLPSLNETLLYLKTINIYTPEDILIIPVTEPYRGFEQQGHFKLLAFFNNAITYYDSKNFPYSRFMHFFTPYRSATQITLEEMAEQLAAAVGLIQQVSVVTKLVFRIPFRSCDFFDRVRTTCHEHFPEMPFTETALAEQYWFDSKQCGKTALETSLSVASGSPPGIRVR